MGNVNIINHPLVKHKITLMRDEKTGTREFRILVEEVAMLMGYEAMRDLPQVYGTLLFRSFRHA